MEIKISEIAAAKLRLLLWEETTNVPLAIHIVLLTSGCNTPSFGIEVIEQKNQMKTKTVHEIPLVWYPDDEQWLVGITIDLNRENGKFIIDHPDPSQLSNCTRQPQGVDNDLDK
jgi:Fe-S cluster assembly iron-binding protein IscA